MFDKLKASRELLLWGAVGSAAFLTVMGLVRWIYEASTDTGSWRGSSLGVGAGTLPVVALLIGLLVLVACVLIAPITKNAHVASLILLGSIGLGALVRLIALFIVLFGEGIDGSRKAIMFFEALGQFALVGVLGFVAYLLMSALAPRPQAQQAYGQQGYGQQGPGQFGQNPQLPPQQPTWQPDQASGGGWNRAGDAASGASASTWGTPGQQAGGWQPGAAPQAPQQPQAPQLGAPQAAVPQPGQPEPTQPIPSWQSQSAPQAPVAEPGSAQSAEEGTVLRPAPPAGQWQPPAGNPNPNPGQWNDGRPN